MMAKAPRGLNLNIGLVFEKAKENISHIGLSSLRSGGGDSASSSFLGFGRLSAGFSRDSTFFPGLDGD